MCVYVVQKQFLAYSTINHPSSLDSILFETLMNKTLAYATNSIRNNEKVLIVGSRSEKYSFNINWTFGDNTETRHFLDKELMNIEIEHELFITFFLPNNLLTHKGHSQTILKVMDWKF